MSRSYPYKRLLNALFCASSLWCLDSRAGCSLFWNSYEENECENTACRKSGRLPLHSVSHMKCGSFFKPGSNAFRKRESLNVEKTESSFCLFWPFIQSPLPITWPLSFWGSQITANFAVSNYRSVVYLAYTYRVKGDKSFMRHC